LEFKKTGGNLLKKEGKGRGKGFNWAKGGENVERWPKLKKLTKTKKRLRALERSKVHSSGFRVKTSDKEGKGVNEITNGGKINNMPKKEWQNEGESWNKTRIQTNKHEIRKKKRGGRGKFKTHPRCVGRRKLKLGQSGIQVD